MNAAHADFLEATERHYDAVVRRLTMLVADRETALDLAQETYLRAYRSWSRFDGREPRAWLLAIGTRLAFNELRRRKLRRRLRPSPVTFAAPGDAGVWEELARLPSGPRAALLMSVLDGYTHAEIARILGAAEGTVSSWLSRSKAQLRQRLRDVPQDMEDRS